MESGRGDDKHCARERWARTTHLHAPPCGPACQVSCLKCTCFHPSARLRPPRCRGTAGGGSARRQTVSPCHGIMSGSERGRSNAEKGLPGKQAAQRCSSLESEREIQPRFTFTESEKRGLYDTLPRSSNSTID